MLEPGAEIIDLFEAKIAKGWWAVLEEGEDGTRNIKVSIVD